MNGFVSSAEASRCVYLAVDGLQQASGALFDVVHQARGQVFVLDEAPVLFIPGQDAVDAAQTQILKHI